MKNKKKLIILLVLVLGIGFALVSSNLSIIGHAGITGGKFQVEIDKDNVKVGDNSVEVTDLLVDETSLTFATETMTPGDKVIINIPIINKGTVDAMINSYNLTFDEALNDYVDYKVTYVDNMELAKKQILKANNYHMIRLELTYKEDEMLEDEVESNYSFDIEYILADKTATEPSHKKCVRAINLNKTTCNNSTNGCSLIMDVGSTITYGNYGTSGTLTSGDAFDCDVVGNGNYNERFYYVSNTYDGRTKTFEDGFVAFLYNYNVYYGEKIYDKIGELYSSTGDNIHGPDVAMSHLPRAYQWRNTGTATSERYLISSNDTNRTAGGTLTSVQLNDYKARLLTLQEIKVSYPSNTNELQALKDFTFYFENTAFEDSTKINGYWLETPNANNANTAFDIAGDYIYSGASYVGDRQYNGIRPVIDIHKSDILY